MVNDSRCFATNNSGLPRGLETNVSQDGDGEFKIKKSASPAPWTLADSDNVISGASSAQTGRYDAEYLEELRKTNSAPPAASSSRFTDSADMEGVVESSIPDASAIFAARKAREQRRAAAQDQLEREEDEDGFIPLSGRAKSGKASKVSPFFKHTSETALR